MQPRPVILCTGFHRSATSATANWLQNAGVNLGDNLVPAHVSNVKGHFEDAEVVEFHDRVLEKNGTNWQYAGEFSLAVDDEDLNWVQEFVAKRDRKCNETGKIWGVKDPRLCLFLPLWHEVLGERLKLIGIVRHWAACVESLHHRHSREIVRNPKMPLRCDHTRFWLEPSLGARMWLAYTEALVAFHTENSSGSILVSQGYVFSGANVISDLNSVFGTNLDSESTCPLDEQLIRNFASASVRTSLSDSLLALLDKAWHALPFDKSTLEESEVNWLENEIKPSEKADVSDVKVHYPLLLNFEDKKSKSVKDSRFLLCESFDEWLLKQECVDWNEVSASELTRMLLIDGVLSRQNLVKFAHFLRKKRMTSLAVHVFEKLQESSEVSAQILYFLSLSYYELKDFEKAKATIAQAKEKNPENQKIDELNTRLNETHNVLNFISNASKADVELFINKLRIILQPTSFVDIHERVKKHQLD